ncbi:MAG TPA: PQQ-dependent sugar dehydrogenase, partial [Tepidisphaeraceae bacterium]
TPAVAADFRTNVHNFWDRGLLGMALHPQFTNGQPYIYVLYTYDGLIGGAAPRWGTVGGTADGGGTNASVNGATASARLSRFAVGSNGLMTGGEQVLIHDWAQQFPSHSVGDLKFGPDGYLYASGGDGASFNLVDYGQIGGNPFNDPANEGGAVRSQDLLSDNDPAGLHGSIIRVDPVTGAAAPGNPYAGSADANKRRVIATGLRNPFRITFRPGSRELYIADTGWNTWEEINRIADVGDGVAENFGWPAYEGPSRQSGYDGQNLPLLEAFYNNPSAHTTPWFAYQHSQQIVSGSGEPTGGSTPTGVAFYDGSAYPAAYKGALFFADYARQRIYVMYAGPDGRLNPASRQVVASGATVELTVGPNGDIFAVNLTAGTITRLVATGYARPPVANLAADKTTGSTPLTVNFDARASTDPDGGTLSYAWDLDGDGAFDDSTAATPSWTYTQSADTTVRLRVTDPTGLSDTKTIVITPANSAPVPTITTPLTSLRYSVGDTISFAGFATDAEDGTLAATRLTWSVSVVHGNEIDPDNAHEHTITSYAGVSSGSFVAPDHEAPSWLVLRLTATDSRGLTGTTALRIDPRTVVLTFQSSPTGLKITFNGTEYTASFSKTVNANSVNSLSAAASQTINGVNYAFTGWSQGGAAAQNFNAPASAATYTATYAASTTPATVKLTGTVIGTTASSIPSSTDRTKPFDGNLTTYFNTSVSSAWTGLDLGSAKTVSQIKFAPRSGYASRMVNGVFQASNSATFSSGVVQLYRITTAPAQGVLTTVNVNPGVAYRYVRYVGPSGSSGNVAEIEFHGPPAGPTPTVPAAPAGLSAAVLAGPQVKLTWTDVSTNETSFVVQRRYAGWVWEDLPVSVGANATTMTDMTAAANVSYEYRVAARNAAGLSAYSDVVRVNTANTGVAPPAAPSLLVVNAVSGTRIDLSWQDNSSTETAFRVERRVAGGSFTLLTTTSANVRTFSDTTTVAGNTYEYRVIATDGTQSSTASNVASATTPGGPTAVPAAPTGLTARYVNNVVQLAWTDNATNETAFRIERRYRGWVWESLVTVGQNVSSYADTSTFSGAAYEYRVVAVNGAGDSTLSNGVELVRA